MWMVGMLRDIQIYSQYRTHIILYVYIYTNFVYLNYIYVRRIMHWTVLHSVTYILWITYLPTCSRQPFSYLFKPLNTYP